MQAQEHTKSAMASRSKERRDEWIGHKLGTMVTDVKFGGKESKREAEILMSCKYSDKR